MPVWDLYSKRKRWADGDVPDVYQYDDVPTFMRVQFLDVLHDCEDLSRGVTWQIHRIMTREVATFREADGDGIEQLHDFIRRCGVEHFLDAVEALFIAGNECTVWRTASGGTDVFVMARETLNRRFRDYMLGYEVGDDWKVHRIDSELVHAEVVKPALRVLAAPDYKAADEELRKAFGHYQKEEFDDCIQDCGKAFESVLKAICTKRKWPFDPDKDTASKLIEIVVSHGLIPNYLDSQMGALQALLKSGVPTVRNRSGGHGSHPSVPRHLAAYALHLTATNVLFLVECERAK